MGKGDTKLLVRSGITEEGIKEKEGNEDVRVHGPKENS